MKYSDVDCYRSVQTIEKTGECRDHMGLERQLGRLLEICRDE